MPRQPRLAIPGVPQHIVQRGNNRQPCFFSNDDHRFYLQSLAQAAAKYGALVHAYVLMTNHTHLLMTPIGPASISKVMQSLGRRYVYYINHEYHRTGSLWEDRFHSSLVDTEDYLLCCYRYIELNPVRAGMVEKPDQFLWSSYAFNGYGRTDALLTPHPEYLGLGPTDRTRQAAYREWVGARAGIDELLAIRQAVTTNQVLGPDRFKHEVEKALSISVCKKKPGRRPRHRPEPIQSP